MVPPVYYSSLDIPGHMKIWRTACSLLEILPTCIVGNNYNYETMLTTSCSKIICTSQRDGFTEWTSSIDVDCCHLETILSVWSKTISDVTCGHYWLVLLYIPASTTGCMVPYNVASNWPILLDTRQLPPHEEYFSGLYKHALQWLWSSWGDWVSNTSITELV